MLRRPKATDTEEDLLAFQEKFMSSGESPSASVKAGDNKRVGSKRDTKHYSEDAVQSRDVVDIKLEGGMSRPPPKRSKFKEERMKQKAASAQDQYELMDSQDTHITKILSEIKEHTTVQYTMPISRVCTKGGFPSAQTLAPGSIAMAASSSKGPVKKSLFAQAFEAHGSSYFGIQEESDQVEPMAVSDLTFDSDISEKKIGSETLERFDLPLISGEGLVSVGTLREAAKEEVKKIHEENVQRLSSLSEEEIKEERKKIMQQLDPNLLSFIKSRHQQKQSLKPSASDHVTIDHTPKIFTETDAALKGISPELSTPTSWVHMDVVERDKMEWMTDVSTSEGKTRDIKVTNERRFSLEGLVIPRATHLPTHLGLHHHGDEPQAAGYTLSELVSLCRSTTLQQRTFSLQLLAKIIQRAKLNEYCCVKSDSREACEVGDPREAGGPVLEQLLAAEVPLLLRYSLDESTGSVMFAAAAGLHWLLVKPLENMVLEQYMLNYFGCVLPSLRSSHDRSHDQQGAEEEGSDTDSEMLLKDIVLGYLNMKLLHRLRYIVEVCFPPTPLPQYLLDVITVVIRHSVYAATQVYSCPRLMDVVFRQFLPLDWSTNEGGVVNEKACLSAMKLVHALCSASRNITASLFSDHSLSAVLVRYTVPLPSELGPSLDLSLSLSTTALLTWTVALGYGLASQAVRDIFPELLKQLHSVTLNNSSPLQVDRDKALLCLVETIFRLAAITSDQLKIQGTTDTHPPPAVGWGHSQSLLALLVSLAGQLSATTQVAPCTGNVLHCLASYFTLSPPNVSPVDLSEQLASLFEGPLSTLIHSPLFGSALSTLMDTSTLAAPPCTPVTPSPPSLPSHLTLPTPDKPALYGRRSMQSADYQQMIQPLFSLLNSVNLVWGCVRLARVIAHSNKSFVNKVVSLVVSNTVYIDYLRKVTQAEGAKVSSFQLLELYLLYDTVLLLQASIEVGVSVPGVCKQLVFDLGHVMLRLLPPGLESVVWELVSSLALQPSLMRTENQALFLEQDVTSLSLRDQPQPIALQCNISPPSTTSSLLAQALNNMSNIRSTIQLALRESGVCSRSKLTRSETILNGYPLQTPSKLLPPCHAPLLPEDWLLLPILLEYNKTLNQKNADTTVHAERVVTMVTCSLQLLLLLEHLHPHLLKKLSTSAKIIRLMCVFLIDNELFLEDTVHDLLATLLRHYCQQGGALDLTTSTPGLTSFTDLYVNLLDQYSAVSYGDHLFSCYLLLPLQQLHPSHLRKTVWGEHPGILRVFSLPLSQLPVPLERFLTPLETDYRLLDMYLSALSTETVRSVWSPLFYLVALHHVHNFIFSDEHTSVVQRRQLLGRVVKLSNQETKRRILFYSGVALSSLDGLKLRQEMTREQAIITKSLLGESVLL